MGEAVSAMLDLRLEAQNRSHANSGRYRRRVGMETDGGEGDRQWEMEGSLQRQDGHLEQQMEMRITNHRNLFFVRLGRWESGRLLRECTFPGAVIPTGLQAREVLSAYIDSDLNPLRRWLDIDSECDVVVEEPSHRQSGPELRKHIFTGRLKPGLQWPNVAERLHPKVQGKINLNGDGGIGQRFRRGRLDCAPQPPRMF